MESGWSPHGLRYEKRLTERCAPPAKILRATVGGSIGRRGDLVAGAPGRGPNHHRARIRAGHPLDGASHIRRGHDDDHSGGESDHVGGNIGDFSGIDRAGKDAHAVVPADPGERLRPHRRQPPGRIVGRHNKHRPFHAVAQQRGNEGRCGRISRRRSGVGQGQSIDWGWGEEGHTRGCRRSLRRRRSAGLGQPRCLPGTGIPGGGSSPRPRVSSGWPGGR